MFSKVIGNAGDDLRVIIVLAKRKTNDGLGTGLLSWSQNPLAQLSKSNRKNISTPRATHCCLLLAREAGVSWGIPIVLSVWKTIVRSLTLQSSDSGALLSSRSRATTPLRKPARLEAALRSQSFIGIGFSTAQRQAGKAAPGLLDPLLFDPEACAAWFVRKQGHGPEMNVSGPALGFSVQLANST